MADLNRARKAALLLELLTSSDEEESEDEMIVFERKEYPKVKSFIRTIHQMNDKQFKNIFRLERETVDILIGEFEKSKYVPKNIAGRVPISAEVHILAFLWFAGNKATLQSVGIKFNIAQSSMWRIIERVMDFLLAMGPEMIKMPLTNSEKRISEAEFRKKSGFRGVLGCIDGTSINIRTPSNKIKSTYTNRHDLPSITLQAICDHERKFIDIFTGVPGKVHDARVLKMSPISSQLPQICSENPGEYKYHILGDGAYPIRPWLLTPYKDFGRLTEEQNVFNKKFSATRVLIENSFGMLKGRFRQLLQLDMHSVLKITKFIVCCCILHNLCIFNDDTIDDTEIIDLINEIEEAPAMKETDFQLRKKGEDKRNFIKTSFCYT